MSAGLDDGRVEQVTSGRDRGAGHPCHRRRDHRLRPHRRPVRARPHRGRPRSPPPRPAPATGRPPSWRSRPSAAHEVNRVEQRPDEVAQGRQGRAPARASTTPRARIERVGRAGVGQLRRQPQGGARGQHRRRAHRGRPSCALLPASTWSPTATPGCRPVSSRWVTPSGYEIFDTVDVEELARDAARQAVSKLSARPAPSGTMPVVIKHGSGGVLFHEACGHGLEADHIAKGASVYTGKTGELGGVAAGDARRRRHDGRRVGHARRSTTRATPRSATCSSRTACSPTTCGTTCGPARRAGPPSGNGRRQSYCTCRWCG